MSEKKFNIEPYLSEIFIAARGFEDPLKSELKNILDEHDRLFITKKQDKNIYWAQDIWYDCVKITFPSIKQASKALRSLGRNWALYSIGNHRRAALIEEQLPKFKLERIKFSPETELKKFGCWTLLDANTIIASQNTYRNAPLGIYEFEENKTFPPNRAYLKLWEVFTSTGKYPQKDDLCFDLGGSPGGWTWVMQTLGAKVIAVDKAPLEKRIVQLPGVKYLQQSAFALDPKDFAKVNWFCSDIICYPDKLYKFVNRWIDSGKVENFVCTIKQQGETNFENLKLFESIPGSQIIHLYHNKNEFTWIKLADE